MFQILCARKYDILMVTADAGQSFGDLTTKYLGRLRKENGTMIAVCTKHYGEMPVLLIPPTRTGFLTPYTLHVWVVKHQSFGCEIVAAPTTQS